MLLQPRAGRTERVCDLWRLQATGAALGIALGRGRRRLRKSTSNAARHEPLKQTVGRAASTNASRKKQMRARPGGWGRLVGRPADRKLGRRGAVLGRVIPVRFMGKVRHFSKRESDVDGVGLFAEQSLNAGETLGFFTGELLSRRGAAVRRRAGAKCIIEYSMGDEGTVYLDGSCGRSCLFQYINSAAGSGKVANVQFVVIGDRLCVETRAAAGDGDELLADYEL